MNLQQFGIAIYPKGAAVEARAGFLTALYVILVPIMSVFFRKKINPFVWVGVLVAIIGVYCLCLGGGITGIYFGDILLFCCAISFATHILAVDKYVGFTGGIKLSILQYLLSSLILLMIVALMLVLLPQKLRLIKV